MYKNWLKSLFPVKKIINNEKIRQFHVKNEILFQFLIEFFAKIVVFVQLKILFRMKNLDIFQLNSPNFQKFGLSF